MINTTDPCPSYLFHRATQIVTALFDDLLGDKDLTQSQVLVMLSIAENPGTSQKLVSATTGIDRSTLTDVTNRLVRKGFVRRQRSRGDARRYNLTLTKIGEEALAIARPLVQDVDQRIFSMLSEEEAQTLVRLLVKAVSNGTPAKSSPSAKPKMAVTYAERAEAQ